MSEIALVEKTDSNEQSPMALHITTKSKVCPAAAHTVSLLVCFQPRRVQVTMTLQLNDFSFHGRMFYDVSFSWLFGSPIARISSKLQLW